MGGVQVLGSTGFGDEGGVQIFLVLADKGRSDIINLIKKINENIFKIIVLI